MSLFSFDAISVVVAVAGAASRGGRDDLVMPLDARDWWRVSASGLKPPRLAQ